MAIDATMNEYDPEDKEFKKAFWDWFDNLSNSEKKRFQTYPTDMATLYFYNKFWRRKKNSK